jgi:hypothetical protein
MSLRLNARLLLPAVALLLGACPSPRGTAMPSSSQPALPLPLSTTTVSGVSVTFTATDQDDAADFAGYVQDGMSVVQDFFGQGIPRPFVVRIFPDRASLTAHWRTAWNDPSFQSECWMVAAGTADELSILSPHAWAKDACEHDPSDVRHISWVVTHELVHVYHAQQNPSPDFSQVTGIDWFVEGLAVYASGQLTDPELAPAADAVASGQAPAQLADAWTGKYRYGVSGSIVQYIDRTWGRDTLLRMLTATTQDEILGDLGVTEPDLLAGWRTDVGGPETAAQ